MRKVGSIEGSSIIILYSGIIIEALELIGNKALYHIVTVIWLLPRAVRIWIEGVIELSAFDNQNNIQQIDSHYEKK